MNVSLRSIFAPWVVVLALCVHASAQRETDASLPGTSFEITGQVRAPDGQATVANVLVRVERFGGGLVEQVATDGTGRFRFSRLGPGQYVVSARAEGHAARSQQLDIGRAMPRQFVLLQLVPEDAPFGREVGGTVDARVTGEAREECEKGRRALRNKKPAEAVTHLERAIRDSPDFAEAHVLLGVTHMELREWGKAEPRLRRASEIMPKASGPHVLLGEVYRRLKKYAEAERSLVEGLKLDRASWRGHYTLGRVYWERGEDGKAAPHVAQALALNPDYPEAHLLAGNIFMRRGMAEHALVEYEEYLRLAPGGEFAELTQENVRKLKKALSERK